MPPSCGRCAAPAPRRRGRAARFAAAGERCRRAGGRAVRMPRRCRPARAEPERREPERDATRGSSGSPAPIRRAAGRPCGHSTPTALRRTARRERMPPVPVPASAAATASTTWVGRASSASIPAAVVASAALARSRVARRSSGERCSGCSTTQYDARVSATIDPTTIAVATGPSSGSSTAANTSTGRCQRYSEYDTSPTNTATGLVTGYRWRARGSPPTPPAMTRAVASTGRAAPGPGNAVASGSTVRNAHTTPASPTHPSSAPITRGMRASSGIAAASSAPTPSSHARVAVEKYAVVGAAVLWISAHPKEATTTTAASAPTTRAPRLRRRSRGQAQHRDQQQDRPHQVELLLDRQRPEVLQHGGGRGEVVRALRHEAPVHERHERGERITEGLLGAGAVEHHEPHQRDRHEHHERRRQDAAHPPCQEAAEPDASRLRDLAQQHRGDEEARDDEEDVHPDEAAARPGQGVIEHDGDDGERAQPLDVATDGGGGGGCAHGSHRGDESFRV